VDAGYPKNSIFHFQYFLPNLIIFTNPVLFVLIGISAPVELRSGIECVQQVYCKWKGEKELGRIYCKCIGFGGHILLL
jgi:hypothetical protein